MIGLSPTGFAESMFGSWFLGLQGLSGVADHSEREGGLCGGVAREVSRILLLEFEFGRSGHNIAEVLYLTRPDLHVLDDELAKLAILPDELNVVGLPGDKALDPEAAILGILGPREGRRTPKSRSPVLQGWPSLSTIRPVNTPQGWRVIVCGWISSPRSTSWPANPPFGFMNRTVRSLPGLKPRIVKVDASGGGVFSQM